MFKGWMRYLLLACMVINSGCHKEEEKSQNTLKLNFQEGDLPSLHPHSLMIYLRGISVAKVLYEGLMRLDGDGKPQLAGAESVEVSPDHLHYTFKLKNNKWSDGNPVTAYQYENAWKEALSPTSPCSRADLLYMLKNAEQIKKGELSIDTAGVKAVDDKTLVVELAYPSPYFYELLAQGICAPLVSPKDKEPLQFNGPFMVDHWKHGDYLKLKRNPNYWAAKEVSLEQIDISMVQDVMTAYALYEKGELDWIGVPFVPLPPELIQSFKEDKTLRSYPIDRSFWIFLNTRLPHLASPQIRKALNMAIDREAITKHILVGNHPLNKPLPLSLQPLDIPKPFEYNVFEAQQIFNKELKKLGLTAETFPPIEITYSQQANRKQIAEYLQQVWSKAFGIKVKAVPQEWNVLRSNLEKGDFQVSGCYEAAFYDDPLELLEKMTSINPNNFSKWVVDGFKKKVFTAKMESNLVERRKLVKDAEIILMDQMPFLPICSDEFMFVHHPDLQGYVFDSVGACDFCFAVKQKQEPDSLNSDD